MFSRVLESGPASSRSTSANIPSSGPGSTGAGALGPGRGGGGVGEFVTGARQGGILMVYDREPLESRTTSSPAAGSSTWPRRGEGEKASVGEGGGGAWCTLCSSSRQPQSTANTATVASDLRPPPKSTISPKNFEVKSLNLGFKC